MDACYPPRSLPHRRLIRSLWRPVCGTSRQTAHPVTCTSLGPRRLTVLHAETLGRGVVRHLPEQFRAIASL
jgi:hypothetical protein